MSFSIERFNYMNCCFPRTMAVRATSKLHWGKCAIASLSPSTSAVPSGSECHQVLLSSLMLPYMGIRDPQSLFVDDSSQSSLVTAGASLVTDLLFTSFCCNETILS